MNPEQRFALALRDFVAAGHRLVEVWDDPEQGFNADERYPLPARLTPPLSLDEWLVELQSHYIDAQGGMHR